MLRGVVFDMDGTLTVPNLDFADMYRRCGVAFHLDILEEIEKMPEEQQRRAAAVIEEMEEEGRRTLQLMPGAETCAHWLALRGVPTALVTRNTAATVRHFHQKLWEPAGLPRLAPAITRDGEVQERSVKQPIPALPPKPHPAALEEIARGWGVALGPGLVMVGDSPSNDVAFGRNAGVTTVLLDSHRKHLEGLGSNTPDYSVQNLAELPSVLSEHFEVPSTSN